MQHIPYLTGVVELTLNGQACVGCGLCVKVCPHAVFALERGKARIVNRDGCMECGACAMNCPTLAVTVSQGVGCASLIVKRWLRKKGIPIGGCC